jgi:hypothetical protein
LAHVKNTRPIYHKNLLWTVFLYIQRIVFHFYCKHYLGSVGTVYGKRIKLLANPETSFLPWGKRYQYGSPAYDSSGEHYVIRRIWERYELAAMKAAGIPDQSNDSFWE